MQTILLICDDEVRRAELHRLLLADFEVYAVSHESAASMQKKIAGKRVIVVEEEDWGASRKISIHPLTGKEGGGLARLIKSLLNVTFFVKMVSNLFGEFLKTGLVSSTVKVRPGRRAFLQKALLQSALQNSKTSTCADEGGVLKLKCTCGYFAWNRTIPIPSIPGPRFAHWQAGGTKRVIISVRWNGKDNNGKPVSSGLYLHQLQAADFTTLH